MELTLQEQWTQLRLDHPAYTRPDLIEVHFQKRLNLLLEFQKAGITHIKGELLSVEENIQEVADILGIIQGRSA